MENAEYARLHQESSCLVRPPGIYRAFPPTAAGACGPIYWARPTCFLAKIRDLWVAEIWSKKAVDGRRGRGLYPAPHRKRG